MHHVKGYLGTTEDKQLIYYTDGKDVYRAPKDSVIDTQTGYLIGRWECTLAHFEHYRDSVFAFIN